MNLKEYSSKIDIYLKNLDKNKSKHFIFVNSLFQGFLAENNIKELNKFTLMQFSKYINSKYGNKGDRDYKVQRTRDNIVKVIEKYFKWLKINCYLDFEIYTSFNASTNRETETLEAYSHKEMRLMEIVDEQILYSNNLLKDYTKRSKGDKEIGSLSLNNLDDSIYYFENVLSSNPFQDSTENIPRFKRYKNCLSSFYGGIKNFYHNILGIHYYIDIETIMAYAIKLIYVTALNVESLFSLNIDSLFIDELTGFYCLRYYKERSTGHIVLNLGLFKESEREVIISTFNNILALTNKIRHLAKEEDSQALFIYQTKDLGVKRLNTYRAQYFYPIFVSKNSLKNDNGEKLLFNLRRFRPTRIKNMVESGYELHLIKEIVNHGNIETTFNYLNTLSMEKNAFDNIYSSISNIRNKHHELENTYKVPLGRCINPKEPLMEVQGLNSKKDEICTKWGLCLFCKNIVITEKNIPMLISYKSQIEELIKTDCLSLKYDKSYYTEIINIIDIILKPDQNFKKETIDKYSKQKYKYFIEDLV